MCSMAGGFITYRPARSLPAVAMGTDASKRGYGGYLGRKVISGSFPQSWSSLDIQVLELYPVLALIGTFKSNLRHKLVHLECDNLALVHCLNSLTSKNKKVMVLMRQLVLTLLVFDITLKASHISSTDNETCDKLSREQVGADWLARRGLESVLTPVDESVALERLSAPLTR